MTEQSTTANAGADESPVVNDKYVRHGFCYEANR